MDTINYLVVAFFISSSLMLAYIGLRFFSLRKQPMKHFGAGILSVCLAFLVWTYIVVAHPDNIKEVVAIGAVAFIASFIMFMLAAMSGVKTKYRLPLIVTSSVILGTFIVVRFFIYSSNPGFTDSGFFAFNVDPVVLYFYAMLAAFNFIPAVYVVGRHIKHDMFRIYVELGLTLVAVGLIVMITGKDEDLQVINGVGIAIGLLAATLAMASYDLNKNIK